ncbi:hypothetical protein [Acetobacter sp. KSO5]|uniref:hypothetical protein n=1 Tax=Acetobacter sp. KSO5 TaxID=3373674 RepID=UPI00376F1FA1
MAQMISSFSALNASRASASDNLVHEQLIAFSSAGIPSGRRASISRRIFSSTVAFVWSDSGVHSNDVTDLAPGSRVLEGAWFAASRPAFAFAANVLTSITESSFCCCGKHKMDDVGGCGNVAAQHGREP